MTADNVTPAAPDIFDGRINTEGDIILPTNPTVAAVRLAELEAKAGYVDSLLDPTHPLHAVRSHERRGLLAIAAGVGPGGYYEPKPKSDEEERNAALARLFGAKVTEGTGTT